MCPSSAQGTHNELMERQGAYSILVRMQQAEGDVDKSYDDEALGNIKDQATSDLGQVGLCQSLFAARIPLTDWFSAHASPYVSSSLLHCSLPRPMLFFRRRARHHRLLRNLWTSWTQYRMWHRH